MPKIPLFRVRLNVRTDKWQIITTQQQKELLKNTVSEFRRLVRCLVGVVNTHWTTIGLLDAKAQIPAVEKLIHATSLNPNVVGRTINIVEQDTFTSPQGG